MSLSIRRASPAGPSGKLLLAALDAYLEPRYPARFNHALSPGELKDRDAEFYVARSGRRPVGCVALLLFGRDAELKRLYVDPSARRAGVAAALLARIEKRARRCGARRLLLETGADLAAAERFYQHAGFRRCGPFADYRASRYSRFFAKDLRLPRHL